MIQARPKFNTELTKWGRTRPPSGRDSRQLLGQNDTFDREAVGRYILWVAVFKKDIAYGGPRDELSIRCNTTPDSVTSVLG